MTETTFGMTDEQRFNEAREALAAAKLAAEAAEAAMAALTHPYRDGETAEIAAPWSDEAEAAFDMVLDASGIFTGAIAKLDEARQKL
ncbi:hypothetical protein [Agrobacterium tumefaciens]|uniref:hypothetical protein n=1 Tax=Agrobacterium tumefaciens TaxID=358 RepID=UPI0015741D2D|nr:hypothetical protein [Agrobacterium tumefaciens]